MPHTRSIRPGLTTPVVRPQDDDYRCSHNRWARRPPMSDESTTATIGDQELALLTWIAAHEGATVGEVADGFGAERGLARSTVLTMMERLRKKGFLTRRQKEGVYRYRSAMGPHDVLKRAVRS